MGAKIKIFRQNNKKCSIFLQIIAKEAIFALSKGNNYTLYIIMATEYIMLSRSNGVAKNGSPYALLKLASEKEVVNLAVWDCQPTSGPRVGQLLYFTSIQERGDKKSANAADMRLGQMAGESHPLYHLIPRPTKRADWDACLDHLLTFCNDEKLKAIIDEWGRKLYDKYDKWPAASGMHHAFPGGLATHTYQMLHMLEGLYPCLPYPIKIERCILAILFHDYGKLREYNPEGDTQEDMYLLGHIYISAYTLQHVLEKAQIDSEEVKCLVHCVLAHHGEKEYGSPVVPCLQEAVVINILDNLSAKVDSLEGTGEMEYCPALNTHAVKR